MAESAGRRTVSAPAQQGARPIRSLPFVLTTLAFCLLFLVVRELHPWTVLSVASWSVLGWLVMAFVASVLGLFLA